MDKKPVHSTILPVTSLQTPAHVSSPASLGFSPAEHRALEGTMFSSIVLTPLTTHPKAIPDVSPPASPAPFAKPSQEKRFLQQESIPESSLFLGEPGCNVSTSSGTHVVLQNMTTTVVKTTLRNDASAQGIIHHLNIASPIHCVFQNRVLTSCGYTAEGLYTISEDLHGSGHFRTEMQLFIGNSPIPQNSSVSASEDVLITVGMQRADSKLKVLLTDCWATPTNNSGSPVICFYQHCPIPNTYTTLLENGNSSKAQIRICLESPGSTCRTLSAGETFSLHRTSWGPLCKSEAGMAIGYIILIALAVFGFVLGVVTLLIFQYQRKTGRYNLRIKSDNFSYQVFYD
uniref:ZP-C domain-containing protein n=1 Tax=Cyanoderma ruficeps TaxID=181631 RepID=A0A8C3QWY1_9PASS